MKKVIIIICTVLLNNYSIAQNNNIINIDLEIEGKPSEYKVAVAKFIYKGDTTVVNIEDGKLTIPLLVLKENATVIFYIDKYLLLFDSIPVSVNDLYPRWTLGIDKKPFEEGNLWMIKKPRKAKILYYLKNNYGKLFTIDRCKKSEVIMK